MNTPPAGGVRPAWVVREELRIGSADGSGATTFGQVKGVAPLEDGRVAVLDAQTQEVRIFGADGRHLATFGGRGNGPGELEAANGLMLGPEGMLWVPDPRAGRMSIFDPDGGFVDSHPFQARLFGFIWSGVMSPDGRIVKRSITLSDRSPMLRVYDGEMTLLDTLPLPPGPQTDEDDPPNVFIWGTPGEGPAGVRSVPWFPSARQLLDPRGVVWSTAFGDPSYRIARWELGGDTTLVLETRRAPVPVTAEERDSVIDVIREALRERGGANQDWSKIPEVKPAVAAMSLSEEGRLWVRVPSTRPGTTWDVYEQDGAYAGTAVTDLSVYPYLDPVVQGDRLWLLATDALDVPYVVRARIEPSGPAEDGR